MITAKYKEAEALAQPFRDQGKYIEAEFVSLAAFSFPENLPDTQRSGLRYMFILGASAMLQMLLDLQKDRVEATDDDVDRIKAWRTEIDDFMKSLTK